MFDRFWIFGAFAATLVLGMTGCSRRDEGSAPTPSTSALPQPPAAAVSTNKSTATSSEPQPDFINHPPVHLKPPCESSSAAEANDSGNRCVKLTLRCSALDQDEPVWLATTPAMAKIKLPEGAKGLRVTVDDEVSAKVCCKAPAADRGPVKVQLRLFTNEVVGAMQEIECP